MNSAPLVDGALELGFFEALIRGDWQAAAHAVAQAPVGAVTHHALPGTVVEPSSADIDAFGFALPLASFALHFPDLFSISVGGSSVPTSSIDLCSTRECRVSRNTNARVERVLVVAATIMVRCSPLLNGRPQFSLLPSRSLSSVRF